MSGRRFAARRQVRLSDTDEQGRLRLDAVARYLQDVASDDWTDAGFDPDAHVWVVRRTWIRQVRPCAADERVELSTWCSGLASAAAARRYSVRGDRGGELEAESIWIHLDHALRPVRLGDAFVSVYGSSAAGRRPDAARTPGAAAGCGGATVVRARDRRRPARAHRTTPPTRAPCRGCRRAALGAVHLLLEYRQPVDRAEAVLVASVGDGLWLTAGGEVRAAAAILPA